MSGHSKSHSKNDLERRRREREAYLMNREIRKESQSDSNLAREHSRNGTSSSCKPTAATQFPSPVRSTNAINVSEYTARKLGCKPSAEDLSAVLFSRSNKFQPGEIVLVLRSRGGFHFLFNNQDN